MTRQHHSELIKAKARALGFDDAGITDLAPTPHQDALRDWLEAGYAGTMQYMHRQASRRMEPSRIAPSARYAIVVTRNYFNADPSPRAGAGRVAKYARGLDYHDALRAPLDELAAYVRTLGPPKTLAKSYIDAGPVPERELAQRAGLGWIGKNTMLIDPRRGSFCFLATVLTDLELAPDEPFEADRCGSCRLCLEACPTDAFVEARVLDSRRCISYLTIEHRGEIDPGLEQPVGDWVFGCDLCQDVCPWNHKFAEEAADPTLGYDGRFAQLDVEAFEAMDAATFNDQFGASAFTRPGLKGMRRNARIVSTNYAAAHAGEEP